MSRQKQVDNYVYNLDDSIGKGTYAQVFKGKDIKTKHEVAIKVLKTSLIKDDEILREGLVEEIKIMQNLHNPNIVQLLDVITTEKHYYIIQEYCNQGDLQAFINKRKSLSEQETLKIIIDLVKGFTDLIKQGIVHRDLKPANILIKNGEYKITDFGFAKTVQNFQKDTLEQAVGTPMFMSPQLLNYEKYTRKCDIWSLGCVVYLALFGITPWIGRSMDELLQNIHRSKLHFPENKKRVSKEMKEFLSNCLQIEEEQRYNWHDLIRCDLLKEHFSDLIQQDINLEGRANYLINDLRQKILKDKTDLTKLFSQYDLSGDMQLQINEFSVLLNKIDPTLTRKEIESVFNKIDLDGSNSIEFSEFEKWLKMNKIKVNLRPKNNMKIRQSVATFGSQKLLTDSSKIMTQTFGDLEESIIQQDSKCKLSSHWEKLVTNLGFNPHRMTLSEKIICKLKVAIIKQKIDLYRLFKKYDKNDDNVLDLREFGVLLKRLDSRIDPYLIATVFSSFDDNGNGEISFVEFKEKLDIPNVQIQKNNNLLSTPQFPVQYGHQQSPIYQQGYPQPNYQQAYQQPIQQPVHEQPSYKSSPQQQYQQWGQPEQIYQQQTKSPQLQKQESSRNQIQNTHQQERRSRR